jgi:nanoRNase/pAp phosphatase (c-di-AMP/oligoRNAs hydrolase)
MIGIYHSKDLDGLCSGAIIRKAYPDAKMIGWDYGQPLPVIDGTEDVIMADISFPMPEMLRITKLLGSRLTIIDHHLRFINEYILNTAFVEERAICNLDTSKSACELTWEHFFLPLATPEWITLLGKWDTWRSAALPEWDELVKPFQYGMRSLITKIEDFEDYLGEVEEVTEKGRLVINYVETNDAYTCQHNAFEINFKGYRAICINLPGISTDTFKSVYNEQKHDIMLGFSYTGKFWKVSMRSIKAIDVSLLASEYKNGGGHFHAAGFEVANINEIIKQ